MDTNCTKPFYAKPCHTPRLIILQIQHTFLNQLFCSRGVFSVCMSACQLRTVHADKHICVCVCVYVFFSPPPPFFFLYSSSFSLLLSIFKCFSHTSPHFHYFMLTYYDYMHMNSLHIHIHWPTYFEREYEHAIQILATMTPAEIVVKELIKGTLDFSLGLFLRCPFCSSLAAAVTQISTQVIRLTLWPTKLLSLVHVCMYRQAFPSLSGQNCGFYLCVGCYVLVCRLSVGYTCFCV